MLVPFITGFAKSAGESIDERDKEIRDTVNERMNFLLKKREQALQQATTRRDELKEQAKQLQALSGNRLTETQIAGIIESGEVDTVITNLRKSSGVMSDDQIAQIYTPEKDYTGTVEGVVGKMTQLRKGPEVPGLEDEQRTAFGLRTTAAAQEKRKFAAAANVTVDDLYRNRLDKVSEFKPAGRLDLRVFATPESDTVVKARLRDNLASSTQGLEEGTEEYNKALGKALSSNKVKTDLSKIRAMLVVEALSDTEGEKPRSTAAINSIITQSLRNGLDVLVTKNIIRWDPTREDYTPITGDVDAIASFIEQKNLIIRDVLVARGLISRDGKVLGGRNAEDAIAPYANIEDGKIVSWKNAATKKVDPQDQLSKTRMPTPEVYAQVIENTPGMSEAAKKEAIDSYTKAFGFNVKLSKEANPNAGQKLTGIDEKRARANAMIASNPGLEDRIRANFKTETGVDL
jgi:hypothetical protein